MKKRFLSVVMMLIVLIGLVGCTPNMTSYLEKTKEIAEWKGSTVKGEADINMSLQVEEGKKEEVKLHMDMKGTSEGKDKAEVKLTMDMSQLKAMAKGQNATEEDLAMIPDLYEINVFVNGDKVYINKGYFAALGTGNQEALNAIKEDYIAISMSGDNAMATAPKAMVEYLNSAEFNADVMTILEKAFEGYKAGVDFKVEGNTFTFEATSEQLVDEVVNAVNSVVANWDKVSTDVVKLANKFDAQVDEATIKDALKEFNKEEFKSGANEVKEAIKGSNIKSVEKFDKDKYTQDMTMNIKFGEMMSMNMTLKAETVRNDNAKVTLPTSVKEISMDEYMDLIINLPQGPFINVRVNGEDLFFEDQEPIIVEGRTLVPVRALLEKLGAKVEWDEATQTVKADKEGKSIVLTIGSDKAMVDGKEVKLDVPATIENGRTLVPLRFLSENLDYSVRFNNEDDPFYLIDIYNTTEEELDAKIKKIEEEFLKEMEKLEAGDAKGVAGAISTVLAK